MFDKILFLAVILVTNIIQGITGFAGTVLAMPPSLLLVGYSTAKPVLNILGCLSGWYVFVGNKAHVNWKELIKIVIIMSLGILAGIPIRKYFAGSEHSLYKILGIFVICLAIHGLFLKQDKQRENSKYSVMLLPLAGIVHGIFVSGGPILISYLARRIYDKISFRATISTVWIFLNSLIFVEELKSGIWNIELLKTLLITIPFLFSGMFIGSKLVARMSQEFFLKLTYILLLISGITLLIR